MFRQIYLTLMGASVGAVAAASCGHAALWLGVGTALGLAWSKLAPEPALSSQHADYLVKARSWLHQVITLRRVSFVIGLA